MDERSTVCDLIAGDVKAFEQVFRDYSRELYFNALGLCNDRDVAEDAVQESFVYLWNHREQIDASFPIGGYLRKAVKNYVLNYLRHQKVRENRQEEIVREQEFLNEEEEDLTSKIEIIRKLIDSLPDSCRRIFIMSVIEGLSYAETAENMGVSVNTVKSQVKIAYKKIKHRVQGTSDEALLAFLFFLSLK